MNVGSGGKAPHPWSRRTKIPLIRNKIISRRDKIKIPKKGGYQSVGKETMGFLSPTFANAPMDLEGKKPAPSTLIYREQHPKPWRLPPSRDTSSSPLALGEALPGSRYFHHHAVVLLELSLNFSSPLAGSRRRRRPRAVRVLNAEAPLFGA